MGVLYGVGVGPGDPEYLTLKAVRIIRESDIIVLPNKRKEDCYAYQIVKKVIPEIEEKQIICYEFPMTKDTGLLNSIHDEIYEDINGYLKKDKQVTFLTIGDPSVYSTYYYIHKRVIKNGKMAQMISGIPSFCAVAARLGISLGEKQEDIHIFPGSYVEPALGENLSGTRIYMKSGKKMETLVSSLEEECVDKELLICGVSNCGLENEKVYYSLEELKKEANPDYLTIIIVKELC